jgi:hypothetical protein
MTGCTEFRQSGPCLIAWQGPTPVAQIAWDAADSGWYINFLSVEQPSCSRRFCRNYGSYGAAVASRPSRFTHPPITKSSGGL